MRKLPLAFDLVSINRLAFELIFSFGEKSQELIEREVETAQLSEINRDSSYPRPP